ncbi:MULTISPECIES: YcaO-like family protein [unclassified Exiguobacterium]|uniref:YcaO-like family protein n=1 Tax=unclassified Exiguobacterium TaxID=2644629 RepID=UPI001BE74F2C|nr:MULTISPECIES: YcaO-like family protein [unclassified Exiguobacterium]
MYHRLEKNNNFNIPSDIFLEYPNYLLFFTHGNYLKEGKIGPYSGFATGREKKNTLLRTIAEGIERRSTMLGGQKTKTNNVLAWDILNDKVNVLNYTNTTFKDNEIDTTGSAVHTSQDEAIYGAIKELYEKNSLFLFWYGRKGNKIKLSEYYDNYHFIFFENSGYSVSIFVNEYFFPIKTIIVLAYKKGHTFFCGLGSSNILKNAIAHALEEVFLIASLYYYKNNPEEIKENNIYNMDEFTYKYIKSFDNLPYKEINNQEKDEISLKELILLSPDFVNSINVMFIQQNLIPGLICVKVYIDGLFNCLPKKGNINKKILINENTIKVDSENLSLIPDCPMS